MLFQTESGSLYQVDTEGKRIRRIVGSTPTTRIGHGDWRHYASIHPEEIIIGAPVLIVWGVDPNDPQRLQTTLTSHVVNFPPESQDN